ncbi:unnamed protein product, partial [Brenthis ino]
MHTTTSQECRNETEIRGGDWQSTVSPSMAAVRFSGGTLGRANQGRGSSSGYGSNAPSTSSNSSNGNSKSFSGRSHYAPDNSRYADD